MRLKVPNVVNPVAFPFHPLALGAVAGNHAVDRVVKRIVWFRKLVFDDFRQIHGK